MSSLPDAHWLITVVAIPATIAAAKWFVSREIKKVKVFKRAVLEHERRIERIEGKLELPPMAKSELEEA